MNVKPSGTSSRVASRPQQSSQTAAAAADSTTTKASSSGGPEAADISSLRLSLSLMRGKLQTTGGSNAVEDAAGSSSAAPEKKALKLVLKP